MSNMAGFFLYFFDFVLSWYVAKVFPKWPWDGSSCPCYYWYQLNFYIIIIIMIIIKITDNITAIPLLVLFSTGYSEVTIKCLNHEWATFLLEYLLLMDVTSIRVGNFYILFPQNWPSKCRVMVCTATVFMLCTATVFTVCTATVFMVCTATVFMLLV